MENTLPNVHQTTEVLGNYEFVAVQQHDVKIEFESDDNYEDPAGESYEEDQEEGESSKDKDDSLPGKRLAFLKATHKFDTEKEKGKIFSIYNSTDFSSEQANFDCGYLKIFLH